MELPISQASIDSINAVFSYLRQSHAKFVFWIRSANFERQLYVSPTYEAIWKRACDELYLSPQSFTDTLLLEDAYAVKNDFDIRKTNHDPNLALFRIYTPNKQVRWIKDYSFMLHNDKNDPIAVAGFAECVSEKEWHILKENPNEKKIEISVMQMFLQFAKGNYKFEKCMEPDANLFGLKKGNIIYIDDLLIALSQRESECLVCLMNGMTSKQIARFMKISHRTAEAYLLKIKDKVNINKNLSVISRVEGLICKSNNLGMKVENFTDAL